MTPLETYVWCYTAIVHYIAVWIDHAPSFIYQRPKFDTSLITAEDIKEGRAYKIVLKQKGLFLQHSPNKNCAMSKLYYQIGIILGCMGFSFMPLYLQYPFLLVYFALSVQFVRHTKFAYQYEDEYKQLSEWEGHINAEMDQTF